MPFKSTKREFKLGVDDVAGNICRALAGGGAAGAGEGTFGQDGVLAAGGRTQLCVQGVAGVAVIASDTISSYRQE